MNVLDILRNDHRQITESLTRIEHHLDTRSGRAPRELFDEFARATRLHQKMLREVLYPQLETYSETRNLIANQRNNDRRIEELLENLEQNQPPEQGWWERLGEIKQRWIDHIEQSEKSLFPELTAVLGAGRLLELSYELEEIPTHQSDRDSAIYPARRLGPRP